MGALSHLRIVEIGSAAAASYCARLFADFGASVHKIESPQGDPIRRSGPFTPKGQSAWHPPVDEKAYKAARRERAMMGRLDRS
jgi:crotonobetainyl-CoA:carnitine CoA-transferase CaiB-like acyl-CoA transferase